MVSTLLTSQNGKYHQKYKKQKSFKQLYLLVNFILVYQNRRAKACCIMERNLRNGKRVSLPHMIFP